MTPWEKHKSEWICCQRCPLCTTRKNVVLARGKIPADVLFIGEGPGESEDVLSQPFIGPAGKLLDDLIERALSSLEVPEDSFRLRMAWTNIVACIPKAPDPKRKGPEPLLKEIEACSPRLEQLLEMVRPRLIIAVGKLAAKEGERANLFKKKWSQRAKVIEIIHPAALLRLDISQQGLQMQRCLIQITDAFALLMEEPSRAK